MSNLCSLLNMDTTWGCRRRYFFSKESSVVSNPELRLNQGWTVEGTSALAAVMLLSKGLLQSVL